MVAEEGGRQLLGIATTPSLWELLLRPRLAQLHPLLSDTQGLRCQTLPSVQILQQLSQGSIDLALLHEAPPQQGLELEVLGEFTLRLYSNDPNATLDSALGEHFIQVEWGERFMRQIQQHYPLMSTARLQLEPSLAAMEWILACGGSAYLAEGVTGDYCREGRLFPVAGAEPIGLKYLAAYRGDSPQLPRIQQLLGELKG